MLRRFPGALGPVSLLFVRFKDEKTGGISGEYSYGFSDPDQGQAIYDEMAASAHPYGEVLYPKVIKAKIPYLKH